MNSASYISRQGFLRTTTIGDSTGNRGSLPLRRITNKSSPADFMLGRNEVQSVGQDIFHS
jgi:hypothetical protein